MVRRSGPLVAGLVLMTILTACGPRNADVAPVASVGAAEPAGQGVAVFDTPTTGRYSLLEGKDSYETAAHGTQPGAPGSLLRISGPFGAPFYASLDSKAVDRLRVMPGWSVERIATERTWSPSVCASVPHAVVGRRWIVMLRERLGTDDRADRDAPRPGLLEIYDQKTDTFALATAVRSTDSLFSLSLRVEDDHSFSFLWTDGAVRADPAPHVARRTVDLTTRRFTDQAVELGGTERLTFVGAAGGGYLVDLAGAADERQGLFAVLAPATADPQAALRLDVRADTQPLAVAVSGRPDALVLSGRVTMPLPADLDKATVVAVIGDYAYLSYQSRNEKAISTEGVAVVDLNTRRLTAAFDHTGTAVGATGPDPAGAPWANGASRLLVLGVG